MMTVVKCFTEFMLDENDSVMTIMNNLTQQKPPRLILIGLRETMMELLLDFNDTC